MEIPLLDQGGEYWVLRSRITGDQRKFRPVMPNDVIDDFLHFRRATSTPHSGQCGIPISNSVKIVHDFSHSWAVERVVATLFLIDANRGDLLITVWFFIWLIVAHTTEALYVPAVLS